MPLSTRPVGESDRDQLLSWRNADRVRTMSIDNRVIDLSYAAALRLDMTRDGTALVEVESLGGGANRL